MLPIKTIEILQITNKKTWRKFLFGRTMIMFIPYHDYMLEEQAKEIKLTSFNA